MKRVILSLSVLVFFFQKSFAQEKAAKLDSNEVKVNYEAYVDYHYVADGNRLKDNTRFSNSNPYFVNQFGLAYAYLQADIQYRKFFARAAFHTGEIVRVMYAGEDDYLYKMIRELSLTYRINNRFEVQTGIFPAIFGSETFINKDNLHATRATMTDFAPDYEAGFRVKYKLGEYWQGTVQMTNGWQVIKDDNNSPGFGMVHVYDKPGKFLFNYGIFAGNEVYASRGALNQFKLYHNLFSRIYSGRWIFAPMFDICFIDDPNTHQTNQYEAYGLSVRYALNNKWGIAGRHEYIHDPDAIINELVSSRLPNGAVLNGSTFTLEYLPAPEVTLRFETRYSDFNNAAFEKVSGGTTNTDIFFMFSAAIKLKHTSFIEKFEEPFLKSQFH
jgi:hypothetical protein